jgi:Listeria-Bacteroides repeat domain (List_Bact_rpt)
VDVSIPIRFEGRLTLSTYRDGRLVRSVQVKNTPCLAGLNDLAAAVGWAGAQDQAALIGAQSAFLTPLYGAVGIGEDVVPTINDTQLVSELARSTVSAVASSPLSDGAATIFQFQFPIQPLTYTITEVGLFTLASVNVNTGDLLDHAVVYPTFTWTTGETMTLAASLGFTSTYVTVTFNANGGSGSMTAQVGNGPTNLDTNTFTYTGFTFNGWNTAADGSGTAYADGAAFPFTANATLYAQWVAV